MRMRTFDEMLSKQLKDEEFRKEYDAVKLEMDIIRENEDDSTKQNNVNKE